EEIGLSDREARDELVELGLSPVSVLEKPEIGGTASEPRLGDSLVEALAELEIVIGVVGQPRALNDVALELRVVLVGEHRRRLARCGGLVHAALSLTWGGRWFAAAAKSSTAWRSPSSKS